MSWMRARLAGGADQARAVRARVRARRSGWLAWRIGVTVLGVGIIALGIVLLPLPGPGWVIIFAGLGLLGTEYEWAARLLRAARQRVQEWTEWVKRQSVVVRVLVGLAGLLVIAGALALVWWISLA
jgi:uncharacterized protein (TIGR02611 family)